MWPKKRTDLPVIAKEEEAASLFFAREAKEKRTAAEWGRIAEAQKHGVAVEEIRPLPEVATRWDFKKDRLDGVRGGSGLTPSYLASVTALLNPRRSLAPMDRHKNKPARRVLFYHDRFTAR